MLKKLFLLLAGMTTGAALALSILTLPLRRRLPKEGRLSLDGLLTIADAIAACRHSGLQGWELVAYAQQLAARKFTYSRLNPWDTPARAFERGRGYCQQQALALKKIYDGLDIPARPVFATRCAFPAKMVDGMPSPARASGHVWLRVKIRGEEWDVCPGSTENAPGVTQFEVLSQVRALTPFLQPCTQLGSVIENIRRDAEARRAAPSNKASRRGTRRWCAFCEQAKTR